MKPTAIGILSNKLSYFPDKFRVLFFNMKGLQIKKGTRLGKISCEWPNNLYIGSDCDVQNGVDFRIWKPFENECAITIGNSVFIGRGCEFVCCTKITLGNNCLIASKTTINDTGHEYKLNMNISEQPRTSKEITIEDDVWIGTSCVILQGVTVGKGSVIGAGFVVLRSIPAYEIWAGLPARFIKKRM